MQDRWINTKDKLPEMWQDVVGWCEYEAVDGEDGYVIAMWDGSNFQAAENGVWKLRYSIELITHWQPLTAGPKVEGELINAD